MQGPFSEELNLAMIRQWNIACLVTKESGRAGGVDQKVSAAQKAGIAVLLIGRPQESEQSFPLEGLKAQLRDRWGICPQQEPKTNLPYFPLFVPLAGKRVPGVWRGEDCGPAHPFAAGLWLHHRGVAPAAG